MLILENSMFILDMGPLLKIPFKKHHQLKTTQESEIMLIYRAFNIYDITHLIQSSWLQITFFGCIQKSIYPQNTKAFYYKRYFFLKCESILRAAASKVLEKEVAG